MWKTRRRQNRNYIWQNFANGSQVLFMDPYNCLLSAPEPEPLRLSRERNLAATPDPRYENFRDNLGYLSKYSQQLNLAKVTAQKSLSSTGYCLAQTPAEGAEYLVYAPSGGSFTVDVSAMPAARKLAVEWFNPATGASVTGDPVSAGSSSQSFTPPFSGDAVLHLVDTAGHARGR